MNNPSPAPSPIKLPVKAMSVIFAGRVVEFQVTETEGFPICKCAEESHAEAIAAALNAPAEGKWVPVGERLPEYGNRVLIHPHDHDWTGYAYRHTIDGQVRWYTRPGPEIGRDIHVTHWMPLPSPPKGKEPNPATGKDGRDE